MSHTHIAQHIAKVRKQVEQACIKFGRHPSEVNILAVSKKQPVDALRQAITLGQRAFGENYLQEALEKQAALAQTANLEWHFIGPLQSNKTRNVAEAFDWVHSLDRLKLAQRLNDQRPADKPPLQVLIQVNVSQEASKSGVTPEALPDLAAAVQALPRLQWRGLMCLPAPSSDPTQQRAAFAQLAALQRELQQRWPDARLDTLSMGMSGDLEAAIAEGSTLVRIGTAIFGARD